MQSSHDTISLMKKLLVFFLIIFGETLFIYELVHQDKVYSGVSVANFDLSHQSQEEVRSFFQTQNQIFFTNQFVFHFEDKIATISGQGLDWGYNEKKISQVAFKVGRSDNILVAWQEKWRAFFQGINLEPEYSFAEQQLWQKLAPLEKAIYQPPQEALFQFKNGRVVAFQKEKEGRRLDKEKLWRVLQDKLGERSQVIEIILETQPILPLTRVDEVNNLGIKEILGKGLSYFWGSSSARIHNLVLAASRLNGLLLPAGEVFSFNQSLGAVSQATGYQQAYVIKEGRTILDDGGGVCQVSTTLFRAALAAGLPILERYPHSYRVSYYEQGGFGPGLDATVFYPTVDLKFRNNTRHHILIQMSVDTKKGILIFELYGTSDGRWTKLGQPKILEQTAPPEDLYQDEPALPQGEIKQLERKAWGAKVSVDWQVKRGEEILEEKTFWSYYQPWQAVYLRGVGG